MKRESQTKRLSQLHNERARLNAERRQLTRDFGDLLLERQALIDDVRRTAEVTRRHLAARRR